MDMFEFSKDGKFLDGKASVGIELKAPNAPAVTAALAGNIPFPPGTIKLGTISTRVKGGTGSIRFRGSRTGSVNFKGSAGIDGGLAVYSTAGELRKDLDPDTKTLDGLEFPETGVSRYAVLKWDYDIQSALKGSVAFGAGSTVKFSADGQKDGLFAVIRAFGTDPPARDAVQSTLDNWMLPGQVTSPERLAPGTWLVTEVDGEFAAKVTARFGFRYNWLRNVGLSGLSGDIGLRIQAAAETAVELGTNGKFLLVVARESLNPDDRILRARISKMSRRGWEFALNARVGVTGKTGRLLPEDVEDLVAGVFGLHGAQLVKDLQMFRQWTDLSVPLPDLFAGFALSYASSRLAGYAGDQVARMGIVRARILEFLDRWSELPYQVGSLLWSELRRNGGKSDPEFRAVLQSLAGASDAEIGRTIEESLQNPAFLDTIAGRWLESAVDGDLLAAFEGGEIAGAVGRAAASTVTILDGKVLAELAGYSNRSLCLDRVREVVDLASLESLEPWLKEKLSRFLGEKLSLEGLDPIHRTIAFFEGEAQRIFESALDALTDTYSVSFEAAYSRSDTKTALLDVCFDFSRTPDLTDLLKNVIEGDWGSVLLTTRPGTSLRKAMLTHAVKRQSKVEINLPYFTTSVSRMANVLARMDVVEQDGRVFAYELGARDEIKAQHRWRSNLAISGKVIADAGGSVRIFAKPEELDKAATYSYVFRMALPSIRTSQLCRHLLPLVSNYLPRWLEDVQSGGSAALRAWADDLEAHACQVESRRPGFLGNTLLSLSVSLPGRVVAAWRESPENGRDPRYMEMSRAMQRTLRRIIPMCYFQDPHRFVGAESRIAAQFLVYQALPVSTSILLRGEEVQLDTDEDLYWDYRDDAARRAMIFNRATGDALLERIEQVRKLLLETDGLERYAEEYSRRNMDRLREMAFDPAGSGLLCRSILFAEAQAIRHAREAGRALARFTKSAGADPAEALESMAGFGRKVAETFNSSLSDLFRGQGPNIRELGSLLFLEAARALDTGLKAEPGVRLEVTVLRGSAPASWRENFLAGKRAAPDSVAVRQSVVGSDSGRIVRKGS
jgi:hypothetical protein